MKITLTFNENNPRMMEAYQILVGAGHRKTELVTSLLLKMQTMYPHIMTGDITSEEVAWFIRGLDYDLISFGESKNAGGGKAAQKSPPKSKRLKRSSPKKPVPERPKLMDPIPEPEPEPVPEEKPKEPEAPVQPTEDGENEEPDFGNIATDEEMALFEKLESYMP